MREKFKFINGTDKKYLISSTGRVLSVKTKRHRFLRYAADPDGYCIFILSINGKTFAHKGHRLVAEYFIPNLLKKPQVNHKNKIKSDNRRTNLEWVTNRQNTLHAQNKPYI